MRIKIVNWGFQNFQHRKISRSQSNKTVMDLYWKSPEELLNIAVEGTESTTEDTAPKKQLLREKCDVYSYSIVLWELLNPGKVPYTSEFKDFGKFVDAVCENERPHLSSTPTTPSRSTRKEHGSESSSKKEKKEYTPDMENFLETLWDKEPKHRPDWDKISSFMTEYALNLTIHDEKGKEFWNKCFQ